MFNLHFGSVPFHTQQIGYRWTVGSWVLERQVPIIYTEEESCRVRVQINQNNSASFLIVVHFGEQLGVLTILVFFYSLTYLNLAYWVIERLQR